MIRVRDAREAEAAARADIDAIELTVADEQGLEAARAARSQFGGRLRLRIDKPSLDLDFVGGAVAIRADEIAIVHDHEHAPLPPPAAGLPMPLKAVAIVPPDLGLDALSRLSTRFSAVMLEPQSQHRLIDEAGITALDSFACACRAHHLAFGLAGGLEPPDVSRLLLLGPDVLGFDRAIRHDHAPDGALDLAALDALRALIPRDNRQSATPQVAKVIDRVFLRNFEIELAIGAYRAERDRSQRVRFSVTADVVRRPGAPRDMRDVFSYDVIIETIRVLSERPHVTFVETLAEDVASAVLAHPEVVGVTVKVEKLDVVPGAVGIEIVRRRETP
jgi:dihydroneopterin aldolase